MILTPIAPDCLSLNLAALERGVTDAWSRRILQRIARPERAHGDEAATHHAEACALLRALGMGVLAGAPSRDFSWNGWAVRGATEAYVLLHEVAHFQLAAPTRRHIVDFGLGPGPETGDRDGAARAARLGGLAREREEAMASLLGILWEVELGHPALASFLDQNWLEGAHRDAATQHFSAILSALRADGFIDAAGRPRLFLRETPDALQESALCGPAKWM